MIQFRDDDAGRECARGDRCPHATTTVDGVVVGAVAVRAFCPACETVLGVALAGMPRPVRRAAGDHRRPRSGCR
jgi:hypothetical protein